LPPGLEIFFWNQTKPGHFQATKSIELLLESELPHEHKRVKNKKLT
jgi:hypothetical protein